MTEKLQHKIQMVLGSSNGEGHGQSVDYIFASNLTKKEITAAYKAGTQLFGMNFQDNICAEYEERVVSIKNAEKLKSLGCDVFDKLSKYDFDENKGYSIWHKDYLHIYLFLCKLGNPEFEYKDAQDQVERLAIGGYGLFGN